MTKKSSYWVESYDSFCSPDERRPILEGKFDSYEEALIFAKEMVAKFIRERLKEGKSAKEASDSFCAGADVPMILGWGENEGEYFQPYEYAELIALELDDRKE